MTGPAPVKSLSWVFWCCLVLGFVGVIAAAVGFRQQAMTAGLRADSLEVVATGLQVTVKDSVTFYTRRVLQIREMADSLSKALALKPAVVIQTMVHVDTVTIHDTKVVVVVDSSGARTIDTKLRQEPYTATIHAELPAPPALGKVSASIALDSIPISLRVGCGDPVGGIRPAWVAATAPNWARLGIDRPKADPDVCNASAGIKLGGVPVWTVPASGALGLLMGLLIGIFK